MKSTRLIILSITLLIGIVYLSLTAPVQSPNPRDYVLNVPSDAPAHCLEGRELSLTAGGFVDTGNTPPKEGCPGYSANQDEDVGSYQLGPYHLKILRPYIWQAKYPDGERDALYLHMQYPDMNPVPEDWKNKIYDNRVKVTLKFSNKCRPSSTCPTLRLKQYNNIALKNENNFVSHIDSPKLDTKTKLRYFTVTQRYGEDLRYNYHVFFEGEDAYNPDYWFYCDLRPKHKNHACNSTYELKDGLWIDMRFSYQFVEHHQRIFDDSRSKLRTFFQTQQEK